MTQRIIVTRGLPASGKTSWANNFVKENPEFIIISKDDFRNDVLKEHNVKWSNDNERKYVRPYWITLMEQVLDNGGSFISCDLNLSKVNINALKDTAKKYNIQLEYKDFFNVSLETCIARDSIREEDKKVGENKIRRIYKSSILPKLRHQSRERENQTIAKYNVSKNQEKQYIVCDIDGTIAMMGDRSPFDWQKVGMDTPIQPVIDVLKNFTEKGVNVIFVSGRDEECRGITETWLKDIAKVEYVDLIMRPNKDYRPDYEVKKEIYENHLKDKVNILFVFDDRPQVVKMWRELGFFVFDVNQSGLDF